MRARSRRWRCGEPSRWPYRSLRRRCKEEAEFSFIGQTVGTLSDGSRPLLRVDSFSLLLACAVACCSLSSAGISRSASLVIAHALFAGLFDTFDDAYAALKASRAIVLPNPSFERILREYASEQKQRRAELALAAAAVVASPASASASGSLDSAESSDSGWSSASLSSSSELRSRSAVSESKEDAVGGADNK